MTTTWTELPPLLLRPSDDEPPLCLSHLYVPTGALRLGPLVCIFDAGHPDSGGPGSLHSGGSTAHPHSWSDDEAAASLATYRATAATTGPVCLECEVRPQSIGGRCHPCACRELAADDIETESEAA